MGLKILEEINERRYKFPRPWDIPFSAEVQNEADCPEFPVHQLPDELINAIEYLHQETLAPRSLIAVSLLGVMGLACQDLYDVSPMVHLRCPLTLFLFTLAEPGERKSTVDKRVMKPVRDLEDQLEKQYQEAKERYDCALRSWRIEVREFEKAFGRAVQKWEPKEPYLRALEECLAKKPVEPLRKRLLVVDATSAAVKKIIGEGSSSLTLLSDEGELILSGDLLRNQAFLNMLWSGQPLDVDRATGGSFRIVNIRFGCVLMVQPRLFKGGYVVRQGERARDSGLFARFLMCQPRSTMGTRLLGSRSQTVSSECLDRVLTRVTGLLAQSLQRQETNAERICLTLSAEARESWEAEFNQIEQEIGPGGTLWGYRDWASKQLEHVARIAGVLEVFVTGREVVSGEAMCTAIHIANYFRSSFIKIMEENFMSEEQEDEKKLREWLNDYCCRKKTRQVPKNEILRYGPNPLRCKKRLERVLNNLHLKREVRMIKNGRTMFVVVN